MKIMSRNEWIAVVVGLAVVFVFFVLLGPVRALLIPSNTISVQSQNTPANSEAKNSYFQIDQSKLVTRPSGLLIEDQTVGTGAVAVAGKTVSVHYVGILGTGEKFDSSRDRGVPFSFSLGAGAVIKGWDEGVVGMKVGGTRVLIIPSELAYGDAGIPGPNGTYVIPPKATLVFQVELLDVK